MTVYITQGGGVLHKRPRMVQDDPRMFPGRPQDGPRMASGFAQDGPRMAPV